MTERQAYFQLMLLIGQLAKPADRAKAIECLRILRVGLTEPE